MCISPVGPSVMWVPSNLGYLFTVTHSVQMIDQRSMQHKVLEAAYADSDIHRAVS